VRKSITAPTAVVHLAGIPICERDGGEAPEEGACGKKRHPSAFEETPADLNRLPPARIPPGLSRERERGEHTSLAAIAAAASATMGRRAEARVRLM
jgi:hypothetical protein